MTPLLFEGQGLRLINNNCFISKRDFIFNNDNLLATDRLAVLVDLMGWAVLICELGFYLLEAQNFSILFMYRISWTEFANGMSLTTVK